MFRNQIGSVCVGAGEGRHFRADQLSAAADGVPSAQLQQGHTHPHALIQGRFSPQVNILTSVADPDPHSFWSAGSGSALGIRIRIQEGQNEP
jgi:hypothetical protein